MRSVIAARTKAAHYVRKARGERVGGIPYGYRDAGGVLFLVPRAQAVITRARELRAEGLPLRPVGRALAESGHRPRGGRRWHVQVVARMTAV